jgi:OOP family OmpA-OmpF porin
MRELRRLLLAPEQRELDELRRQLDALDTSRPERVAQVLPEAVLRRTQEDDHLAEALRPTIENTLQRSVERNPQTLADALFPVIGPAIRKSIRETLSSMLQTINQTLEHSLSPRSLRWRFEAWRTGQPFAQIVLRHTLQYRVEQLFLIDRETGLPLAHVINEDFYDDPVAPQDAEGDLQDSALVTSMLTAIQDFVEDSFGADETETLETLQVGDLTVWIEPGPHALIAAVIRGIPPADLREVLRDLNETIHLRFHDELETYEGDSAPFEQVQPLLRTGLREQFKDEGRALSPAFGLLLAIVLVLLGLWLVRGLQERHRWHRFLHLVADEPGLVVVETERSWSTRSLQGLRDPLATPPDTLLHRAGVPPKNVIARWTPYQALDPAIVLRRATRLLAPPPSVDLHLEGETLVATGPAPDAWISTARDRARFVPGIAAFSYSDPVSQRLDAAVEAMTQRTLRFLPGTAQLRPDQQEALRALDSTAQHLLGIVEAADSPVRLQVVGHASTEGSSAFNVRISQARADTVRQRLIELGWAPDRLTALGTGTPRFPSADATAEERAANRSVSFQIVRDTTGS